MKFAGGDRVKLVDRYALALDNSRGGVRGRWTGRVGTVKYSNKVEVVIQWDDRKSLDRVPLKGVEKINRNPTQGI